MEALLTQLKDLPAKLAALPRGMKVGLAMALIAAVGLAVGASALSQAGDYQYAYTNLTPEDAAEITAQLKVAGLPHRLEAGGTALAVPASRVYDVRLLLAAAGLPRSGGTGFELFDKGDFGVSEFTQKVNLRRATEGELARTISRIAGVRSARVHLVLSEKAVFRSDERAASAAVMLTLHGDRTLTAKELAGIRHLVASAVPALTAQAVTVVDGRGAVLTSEDDGEELQGYRRKLEHDFETRLVSLLEPVIGAGQVVARVTADVDSAEVTSTQDAFDPDGAVLKSERTQAQNQASDTPQRGGVAGAAANQPLNPQTAQAGPSAKSTNTTNEETRNYEVSRTTTRTVQRMPRLTRLSIALLVDGLDGKARPDAELQRLGELARKAVGFDSTRGDQLEISSAVFTHSAEPPPVAVAAPGLPTWIYAAAGGGALLVLGLAGFLLLRRARGAGGPQPLLRPGMRVAELEAASLSGARGAAGALVGQGAFPALPESALAEPPPDFRDKARDLVKGDPARAANLLRAWISPEGKREPPHV